MQNRRSLFYDALLLTGTNLLLRAVSLAFSSYTAVLMGAGGVGLLQLIFTVGLLAGTVGSSGVRVAAMVLSAREFGRRRAACVGSAMRCCLVYAVCVSTAAAALLYALCVPAAKLWVQDLRAVPALRVTALFLPATVLCSVMGGYFTACGKIRVLVFTQIAERLLAVGVTLFLLLFRRGDVAWTCAAIVGGSGVAAVLSFAALYLLYRKDCRHFTGQGRPMGKELLRLCIPLALGDYLRQGLSAVEQFLIPYGLAKCADREAGMAAYGTVVGMAFPVVMFPAALIWSVADLLVPALSRCLATGNTERIRELTDRCFRLGTVFAALVAGTLWLTSDVLGRLLYHSGEAGYYIRIFSPMVLFLYLDAVVDGMHKGLGQQVSCVRYNTFTNVIDVVGLYTLLPVLGVAGYVLTYAVSHLVNFFLSIRRLLVVTGYAPSAKRLSSLLALLLICGAVCALLPPLVGGVFFIPLFVCSCCHVRLIRKEDRAWLSSALHPPKKGEQSPLPERQTNKGVDDYERKGKMQDPAGNSQKDRRRKRHRTHHQRLHLSGRVQGNLPEV